MSLGSNFEDCYLNFFKFFSDSSKTIKEINDFISLHSIQNFSSQNKIHLNMIDRNNLNILFHIIRTSKTDEDCLEKLKLLIEQYNINYTIFDINRRTLPFYTCVKGYLNSTKYLIEKMDFNIAMRDKQEETLFFSAIRSYNIDLVKYLDNKYKGWIFYPNKENNSCIFSIFKKTIKDEKKEKIIKNLMKFIIEKGFSIDDKNKDNVSFRDLCVSYKVENYLNDVIKEKNMGNMINKKKEQINNNENIVNMDIEHPSNEISNINRNNKKEEKNNNKSSVVNSNSSPNHIKKNNPKSNIPLMNGKIDNINKDNKNNENVINNTPIKKKKICCIFQNTKNDQLIVNKIYEKFESNEYMKEKYLSRMNDYLKIPSFEKGSISIIKKSLKKGV